MNFPLPPDALDRNLVFNFFWTFSAFDCALKRGGFLTDKDYAEADWIKFGSEIACKFSKVNSLGFQDAVKTINLLSPRRQMNIGGRLAWQPVTRKAQESDAAYTLKLLKTVRNNLFHGGKYPDGPRFQIARDREILRAALIILDGCYGLHPRIKLLIDDVAA
jgi:hypothetical protein